MNNILLDNNEHELHPKQVAAHTPPPIPKQVNNIFQGRAEEQSNKAAFPEWDIVPPNQIINPRLKHQ